MGAATIDSSVDRGTSHGTAARGPVLKVTDLQLSSHSREPSALGTTEIPASGVPTAWLPTAWRVILDTPSRAAWNMAADATLPDLTRGGDTAGTDAGTRSPIGSGSDGFTDGGIGVLRIYSWSQPAVSFGRNEALNGRFDRSELENSGYDLVRRPTGGRALLHAHEITYAAAIPLPAGRSWRGAYDSINLILCRALTSLGVPAHIVADNEGIVLPPAAALCFTAPSAGELVAGGAKLVASAVWRDRESFLQQGSILVSGDQEPLRKLSGLAPEMVGQVATLSGCGVSCDFDTVAEALVSALRETATVTTCGPDELKQRVPASRVSHFGDPDWLWRR